MCGRFVLKSNGEQIAQMFELDESPSVAPRFNIAPSQPILAIRLTADGRQASPLRWGLIPHWAKEASIGNRMINARAETVAEKPSFRAAFRRRRCLVPADGYYEWAKTKSGKQPYFIQRQDGRSFAMAGLWERWQTPEGETLESTALMTTQANADLSSVHDRMPLIVDASAYQTWLDPLDAGESSLMPLLKPAPEGVFVANAVGRAVNNPRYDRPDCIDTVQLNDD